MNALVAEQTRAQPGLSGLAARAAKQGWLKWAIVLTASFAAILEVVDLSIVNVALPYMQGNLGATLSEIGWVSTGYTMANVIIIPLTAWLGIRFGRKNYFLFSLISFTAAFFGGTLAPAGVSFGSITAKAVLGFSGIGSAGGAMSDGEGSTGGVKGLIAGSVNTGGSTTGAAVVMGGVMNGLTAG